MYNTYTTFKLFNDRETAEDFAEVLKNNSIDFEIEEDSLVFDPSYANNPLNKDYIIKLQQKDFLKATKAYEAYFESIADKAPADYYLFSFTDSELKEIITKPDEWGSFDYQLSQRILNERDIIISEEEKQSLKSERYNELRKPEQETKSNIIGYYIVGILFFPVGIIIGWVWAYSKKTLPDGKTVRAYDRNTQQHGQTIFIIAITLFIVIILSRILGIAYR
jgi:hypothetical protein